MERNSVTLQTKLEAAVLAALGKLVAEADWDFAEDVSAPVIEYVKGCATSDEGTGFFVTAGDEASILFEVCDEDVPLISEHATLFEIYDKQYEDCFQSAADLILSLEDTVARLKESYAVRFGIPFEIEAIDGLVKSKWPGGSYNPWTERKRNKAQIGKQTEGVAEN